MQHTNDSRHIAVLLTVFNRRDKTLACLDSLLATHKAANSAITFEVFLTDDGSSDGTKEALLERHYPFKLHILQGTGSLFWNAGMNNSWQAAIDTGNFYGYLWLNNDITILDSFWKDLSDTDSYCHSHYNCGGIYVGSTRDSVSKKFSYGGFDFIGKWRLKDRFVMPNGISPQPCQCGHGNITFVSSDVCQKQGILYDKYIHGGGDHDYTYMAYRAGFPVLVMPNYEAECENDHREEPLFKMNLRQRLKTLRPPHGTRFHNTLIFQKRCFPYRYPFVWLTGVIKVIFPKSYIRTYNNLRK